MGSIVFPFFVVLLAFVKVDLQLLIIRGHPLLRGLDSLFSVLTFFFA